ncbi:efflux RND transporter periplasmic adaptor subunit [Rubrivivax rivuli]|uniref:Efflux RND transporter periplasmic adaptor subunit n=1 Tax=Rubrivivax rivuli TaxID=1862385 RepID=A0A437RL04_9BURK|nr:efflux RND transporter periplasmic adaptor subunit [Rubrivivax rivuli]RVU47466.1 efflux RND transporter periplasmic adaptor subunit [Rubrivivax rivuli]
MSVTEKNKAGGVLRRRWQRHTRLRWLLILALAAGAYAGWRALNPPPPPPPPPSAKVEKADITQLVQAAGVLQAKTKVDVGAQVSGQIQTLHVQLGQQVKKGELLVSLDPELARNDVARAEAALLQQRALLESRQVDLATARRERDRQRRLLAGDATAALEAERAESDLAKLEAEVRGQSAVMSRLQADLAQAQVRLGYTRITAPMDGTVVSLPVQVGQTVIAVQITPVMLTLADLDTITVRTKVPEADIQTVQVGQVARFTTLAGEGQFYEGKLRVIQPVPERVGNAVFYNVLFEVDNRARKLYSDMTVQVDVETGRVKDVLAMPMVALGERGKDGRFRVTVLDKDQKQQPRFVRTGLQDGTRVQVLEGLQLGDTVLTAPPSAEEAAKADAAASAASASKAAK